MAKSKQISPAPGEGAIVRAFSEADAEPLRARALAELSAVQGVELADDDDAKAAAALLLSIAGVKKDAAAQSKAWLEPLKAETARIREPYKAIEDLCDTARRLVDRAIGAYQLAKAQEQRRALAAATEAVKADNAPALTVALQAVAAAAPLALKGVTVRARWVATVRADDMVPHEYLTPDVVKIGQHAARFTPEQTPSPIPGVVFTLETSTTACPGR